MMSDNGNAYREAIRERTLLPSYNGTERSLSQTSDSMAIDKPVIPLHMVTREQPLTDLDFVWSIERLSASFGIDYYDSNGLHHAKAKNLFIVAQDMGMSGTEFRRRVETFCRSERYPTWTAGAFFANERPQLYSYQWMCAHKDEYSAGLIGGYVVPGYDKPLWGYVAEIGDALERKC